MGIQGTVGDRLRERLRDERDRHGWSQPAVAAALRGAGVFAYTSTVAKIEAGDRAVRVDELNAYADIFGLSVDALMGRSRGGDLAWAASKLTSNAQKMASDIEGLRARLRGQYDDVRDATGTGGQAVDDLLETAGTAIYQLVMAQDWLNRLANQFPLPTEFGPAPKGEEDAGPKI